MENVNYKNIAIIKLSSHGDIIHTIPAFNFLRKRFPASKISWIVEPSGSKLLTNFYGIDEVIVINLKIKGFLNKIKEFRKITKKYKRKFNLIIDFQGLIKSAFLSYSLKGYSCGFNKQNLKEPFARHFYNKSSDYFDENKHVIFKNMDLALFVSGFLNSDFEIHYPLKKLHPKENLNNFIHDNNLEKNKFIIVNIGGGWDTKVLEPDQFIFIINKLKTKFKTVILWGNINEKRVAKKISKSTNTIMTYFMSFDELILFIKYAAIVITSDTLALHIADMVKTPSVGIFGPTSPQRNGSLLKKSINVFKKLPCSFCYKKKCDRIECLKQIDINKIIKATYDIYKKIKFS